MRSFISIFSRAFLASSIFMSRSSEINSFTRFCNSWNFSIRSCEKRPCFSPDSSRVLMASVNFFNCSISSEASSSIFFISCCCSQLISSLFKSSKSVFSKCSWRAMSSSSWISVSSIMFCSFSPIAVKRSAREGNRAIKVPESVFLGPETSSLSYSSK